MTDTGSRRDDSATPEITKTTNFTEADPGEYWTSPSLEDLKGLNRMQRSKIDKFIVGRENVGQVEFKVPVDLGNINLDEIIGNIVLLTPRSATVYPESAKKPPMGKGLNVPARISLEQSWSRNSRDRSIATDPRRITKHVDRLKSMPDTTFEDYDHATGVWTFSVEHFTTYGFDDEDEDTELDDSAAPVDMSDVDDEADNGSEMMEDDTFDFRRHREHLPGAFDNQSDQFFPDNATPKPSFLGNSSVDSAPHNVQLSLDQEADLGDEYDLSDDEDMARSSIGQHHAAEQEDNSSEGGQETKPSTPGGILRARMRAMKESSGPYELEIAEGDDWMEMLRKSVSPVKRDRQLLREINVDSAQNGQLIDFDKDNEIERGSVWKKSMNQRTNNTEKGQGFATSIDLMNSLFEKPKPARSMRASVAAKGFPKVGPLIA